MLQEYILRHPNAQTICVIGHPASGKSYLSRELNMEDYNIIDCDSYLSDDMPISALLRDLEVLDGSNRPTVLIGNLSTENLQAIAPDVIIKVQAHAEFIQYVYERERDISKLDIASLHWISAEKTAFFYCRDNDVPTYTLYNTDGRKRSTTPQTSSTRGELATVAVTPANIEKGVFNAAFFDSVQVMTLGNYSSFEREAAAAMAAGFAQNVTAENVTDAETHLKRLQAMRLEATKNNKLISSPLNTAKTKVLSIEKDVQALTAKAEEDLKRAIDTHKRELQAAQERYLKLKRECETYGIDFDANDANLPVKLQAAKDEASRLEREAEAKYKAEQAAKAVQSAPPVTVQPLPSVETAKEYDVTIKFCAPEGKAQHLVTRIQQMLKDAGASGCFNVLFEIKDTERPAF